MGAKSTRYVHTRYVLTLFVLRRLRIRTTFYGSCSMSRLEINQTRPELVNLKKPLWSNMKGAPPPHRPRPPRPTASVRDCATRGALHRSPVLLHVCQVLRCAVAGGLPRGVQARRSAPRPGLRTGAQASKIRVARARDVAMPCYFKIVYILKKELMYSYELCVLQEKLVYASHFLPESLTSLPVISRRACQCSGEIQA